MTARNSCFGWDRLAAPFCKHVTLISTQSSTTQHPQQVEKDLAKFIRGKKGEEEAAGGSGGGSGGGGEGGDGAGPSGSGRADPQATWNAFRWVGCLVQGGYRRQAKLASAGWLRASLYLTSISLPSRCAFPHSPLRREQLIGLTDVTRSHFDKLVNEFEKGLDEALKEYDGEQCEY